MASRFKRSTVVSGCFAAAKNINAQRSSEGGGRFCLPADLYSGRRAASPFSFTPEMRSDDDGWIKTVMRRENTNRVHGAVGARQVQVNQTVGLGQEQEEVLHGGESRERRLVSDVLFGKQSCLNSSSVESMIK